MRWQVRVAEDARHDIADTLAQTFHDFGARKCDQYVELIDLALDEIAIDPTGVRSKSREDLRKGMHTLHIGRRGKRARHLLVYRIGQDDVIDVLRLLYDGMELERHLAGRSDA